MTKLDFDCDDSRFLKLVTYDTETLEMSVMSEKLGKETIYTCVDVPRFIFDGFKNAKSKGKFFNMNVRKKFSHKYFK